MNKLLLQSIHLRNFKGIFAGDLVFNGQSANIFAANEVGKSTYYDAFLWCLTGKDQFNRDDYEIKSTTKKDLNRNPHTVELVWTNGVSMKRTYLEKWVRERGAEFETFKGHETEYTFNLVPCKTAKEYQEKVDAFINPQIIKMVTNPTFFNSLKWEDQRRGLIKIAGIIINQDILSSIATPDRDFAALINVLNSKSTLSDDKKIEEYKAQLAAKKLFLKKKSADYKPRLDEAKRNKPESKDWDALQAQITAIEGEIASIEAGLADASKALAVKQQGIMAKQQEAYQKEQAITAIRRRIEAEIKAEQKDHKVEIDKLGRQIFEHGVEISRLKGMVERDETNRNNYAVQITTKQAQVARIRAEWDAINAEKFILDPAKCECPTCKRAFDADVIEEKTKELQANFNADVIKRKADKVSESNLLKEQIKQYQENIAAINAHTYAADIQAEQEKTTALQQQIQGYQLDDAKTKIDPVQDLNERMGINQEAIQLAADLKALQAEIISLTAALGDTSNEPLLAEKRTLQTKLDGLRGDIGVRKVIEQTDRRIKELLDEERETAQAIAAIEQQEFEIETFTRAKMDVLQSKVNGMFKYVQWRLFEVQVNGAIAETCVCEYKGVPYPTLNTAAKLLAGLDVLNTLSRFYDTYAPVWCDNRESVSWIPQCESQVISLFVSPEDKVMRVELI